MSNKLSRRQFLKYAGSGAAAFAAAYSLPLGTLAQGNSPPTDISANLTIFNWGGAEKQAQNANAIARFNEVYPNVVVEDLYTDFTAWGEYITKLKLRIASGLQIDVIALAIEGAREAFAQDVLLPMDDFIAADPVLQAIIDETDPVLRAPLQGLDGQTYFFLFEWNNMIIHYNTAIFEAAGLEPPSHDWTWDDFLETALTLTTGEGADKQFGFSIPYFNFGISPWFHTNGTSVLSEDWTTSNLDDPKMLESVRFIHSLVYEHGVSPEANGSTWEQEFFSGRSAMTGAGRWPFAGYIANDFRTVDITPWPRKETQTTSFGMAGFAVAKASPNPDLAVELIKHMNSVELDEEAIEIGAAIPARRQVTEDSALFNEFPASAYLYFESLQDAKAIPSPANFAEVEGIFMRHMDAIMANSETPEQGLELAHGELTIAMDALAERLES